MNTFDIARRAARSLRNAKARTILTSLAIAVGAFTITVSLAAGEGARQYANDLINSNVNPQALFIVKDNSLFEGGAAQSGGLRVYDPDTGMTSQGVTLRQVTQEDIDTLTANPDLEDVFPTYAPSVQYMRFEGSETQFTADITTYNASIISEAALGQVPPQGESIADDEAVLPESYADLLIEQGVIDSPQQLIGKQLTMVAVQPRNDASAEEIAAALTAGGQAAVEELLQPETQEFTFIVRALSSRSANALTSINQIQIAPGAARAISEFTTRGTEQFQKYFGATALVKEGLDPQVVKESLETEGFFPQTAKDLQGVVFTVVNTLQGIVLGFGIVALIASVFGIINTVH